MMKKICITVIAICLLTTGLIFFINRMDKTSNHEPIRINSDLEFDVKFPSRVISEFEINGTGKDYCIYIGNCSKPFSIVNCILYAASTKWDSTEWYMPYTCSGLILYNVTNGNVINNVIMSNNDDGISLVNSSKMYISSNTVKSNQHTGISIYNSCENIISENNCLDNDNGIAVGVSERNILMGNLCKNNYRGILVSNSASNVLVNNTYSDNRDSGVEIFSCEYILLKNNTMNNNGIDIGGGLLKNWNTHSIDRSNVINGRPIYYLKNKTGGKIPKESSEVILANCTNINIEGLNINNGSRGIQLGFSDNNTIINNTIIFNKGYSISLSISNNNAISKNLISLNFRGIVVWHSKRNIIKENIITENKDYGIIINSQFNHIFYNNFERNNYRTGCAQAMDCIGESFWNASDKGNYWSDWTTPDIDSNGFIDKPYFPDGGAGANDSYPLTKPIKDAGKWIEMNDIKNIITIENETYGQTFTADKKFCQVGVYASSNGNNIGTLYAALYGDADKSRYIGYYAFVNYRTIRGLTLRCRCRNRVNITLNGLRATLRKA